MVADEVDTAFDGNLRRVGASAAFGRFGSSMEAKRVGSDRVFKGDGDWGE
jgi:hypothetical protein